MAPESDNRLRAGYDMNHEGLHRNVAKRWQVQRRGCPRLARGNLNVVESGTIPRASRGHLEAHGVAADVVESGTIPRASRGHSEARGVAADVAESGTIPRASRGHSEAHGVAADVAESGTIPRASRGHLLMLVLLALATGSASTISAAEGSNRPSIQVDDAYVRQSADGSRWKIGTNAVEWTYEFKDGSLTLAGFENKTVSPPREYIAGGSAMAPFTVKHGDGAAWVFRRADAGRAMACGMSVAKIALELQRGALKVRLHAIAYPGTSILRQWVELENTGAGNMTAEATPWGVAVQTDQAAPFTHYWMIGGNSVADQGVMHSAP